MIIDFEDLENGENVLKTKSLRYCIEKLVDDQESWTDKVYTYMMNNNHILKWDAE